MRVTSVVGCYYLQDIVDDDCHITPHHSVTMGAIISGRDGIVQGEVLFHSSGGNFIGGHLLIARWSFCYQPHSFIHPASAPIVPSNDTLFLG